MVAFSTSPAEPIATNVKPFILVAVSRGKLRDAIERALSPIDAIVIETTTVGAATQLILRLDLDLIITDGGAPASLGPDLLAGLHDLPVECQRPEIIVWSALPAEASPAEAALIVPQAAGEASLTAAVEAVLDDPLGFILKAQGAP